MSDVDLARLSDLVSIWWRTVNDFTHLLDELDEQDWDTPTDLPGWDVRAVASHVAHLESLLAGGPKETADVPRADHIRGAMGEFTETGVLNRRDRCGREIIGEVRSAVTRRYQEMHDDPPIDPDAPAPGAFGAIGWSTETLLRNRPLDVWMHEQDIRRATGRPGNLDSPGADHAAAYLLESVGFVLAKKTQAPTGTTLLVEVEGSEPVTAIVDDAGRGHLVDESPASPTVRVRTDREGFLLQAGGRRPVEKDRFTIDGDRDLGERFVQNLAVTP